MNNLKNYGYLILFTMIIVLIIYIISNVNNDKVVEHIQVYDTAYYNIKIDSLNEIIDSLTSIDKLYTDTIIIKIKSYEKKADSIYNLPTNMQIELFTRYTDSINK